MLESLLNYLQLFHAFTKTHSKFGQFGMTSYTAFFCERTIAFVLFMKYELAAFFFTEK